MNKNYAPLEWIHTTLRTGTISLPVLPIRFNAALMVTRKNWSIETLSFTFLSERHDWYTYTLHVTF